MLGILNSARACFAITPAAGNLPRRARAIYVGATGNITIKDGEGTSVTFTAVPAGTTIYAEVVAVTAATATGLVGLV